MILKRSLELPTDSERFGFTNNFAFDCIYRCKFWIYGRCKVEHEMLLSHICVEWSWQMEGTFWQAWYLGTSKTAEWTFSKKTQNVKLLPCAVFEPEVKQQWKITHHFPKDNWLNKGKSTDHKTSRPPPSQWLFVPLGSLGSRGCFYPMLRRASKLWYMSDKESLRCPADVLD